MSFFRTENPHNEYHLLGALGLGASAIVFQGVNRHTNEMVAIKIMTPDEDGEFNFQSIQTEIEFLREFSSPFIVSYLDGFHYENNIWIILQYCAGGGIIDTCHILNIFLTEEEIRDIVACVTLAIRYIHDKCCIHRDLKASNILLTSDGRAVLADFGVAVRSPTFHKRSTVTGTPQFMSPEMLVGGGYGHETDMWSLGITLIELCEGEAPNGRGSLKRIITRTVSGPTPTLSNQSKWSPELIDFLERCLVKEASERATCDELLAHPWLAEAAQRVERESSSNILSNFLQRHIEALKLHRDLATESFLTDPRVIFIRSAQLEADQEFQKRKEELELEELQSRATAAEEAAKAAKEAAEIRRKAEEEEKAELRRRTEEEEAEFQRKAEEEKLRQKEEEEFAAERQRKVEEEEEFRRKTEEEEEELKRRIEEEEAAEIQRKIEEEKRRKDEEDELERQRKVKEKEEAEELKRRIEEEEAESQRRKAEEEELERQRKAKEEELRRKIEEEEAEVKRRIEKEEAEIQRKVEELRNRQLNEEEQRRRLEADEFKRQAEVTENQRRAKEASNQELKEEVPQRNVASTEAIELQTNPEEISDGKSRAAAHRKYSVDRFLERKSSLSSPPLLPVPGTVIKTRDSLGNKVFINVCSHPRIKIGCWSSFGESRELGETEEDIGFIYDLCCNENILEEMNVDATHEKHKEVAQIVINKLNETFEPLVFGPEYSFPKTRGSYKGGKIHTMAVDPSILYAMDRPIRYIGWIKSRGKVWGTWRRSFCVLENGYLMWYRDEAMTELKRQIFLKDIVVSYHSDDPSIPTSCAQLRVPSIGRTFLIKFNEKISRATWLQYLHAHEDWAHRLD